MFFAPALRRDSAFAPILPDLGFERFMGDALRGPGGFGIEDDDRSWVVTLDLPGVAREHLNVSVTGNTLRVETTDEARRQYRAVYELPGAIDADATEAQLEHGVLTLRIGKAQARERRQIAVR
jgi:HSP20 family protein